MQLILRRGLKAGIITLELAGGFLVLIGPDDDVMPKRYAIWPYTGVTYRWKDRRHHPPA